MSRGLSSCLSRKVAKGEQRVDLDSFKRGVLEQTNIIRKQQGLPPITAKGTFRAPRKSAGVISRAKREKLFKRDRYTCQICGRHFPQRNLVPNHKDHDRTHNSMNNLETTCVGCNLNEGVVYARLLREAGPRSEIPEIKRLQIVDRARVIMKEQVKRR